ncbi:MAG: dihydrofolate reductase [Chloroflexi bacterium]|jgi:dihydrofolate reductase|nr:dihydrofolate reductase [Chloroflexota bacterium]MBT7079933.1 dihydrofolate reductase [Chloroflexota bacterium]MBT7290225.1 dihydrofolate reductase [Chloroflexota bacterium]
MTNHVYIATSLDGYIATSDGGLDWLNQIPNPQKSDFGYAEFNSRIDAIVMGRITFEKVLTFGIWPYDKPVFILSTTLTELPDTMVGKAEIVNGDLHELIKRLKKRGYNNLYIDGGRTIQNFLQEDLIDEMIITRVPILLGDGVPLFGKITQNIKFKHKKTEILNNYLAKSSYTRDR